MDLAAVPRMDLGRAAADVQGCSGAICSDPDTHLLNELALKIDSAQAYYPYLAISI